MSNNNLVVTSRKMVETITETKNKNKQTNFKVMYSRLVKESLTIAMIESHL